MVSAKFSNDGFSITAAEPWIREKISVIHQYLSSFVLHLHGRVDEIVFVNLYAGNGLYSLGAKREIFPDASLMALAADLPIHRYLFCGQDAEQANILKIRINKYFREKNSIQLVGKPEDLVDRLRLYIPQSKDNYKTAVFCLCDPFSIDIPFSALRKLSDWGFSFLVPFNFVLNNQIDYRFYLEEQPAKLKIFLGDHQDMGRLQSEIKSNSQFYKRLIQVFENNMMALGMNASNSLHKIDSGLMEEPLYCIGLFSKQVPTKTILQDVESVGNIQFPLFN